MPAFRIVEALDVIEYISSRLVSGAVRFAPYALSSRRGGKRVGRSCLNNPDRRRSAGFEARPRKKNPAEVWSGGPRAGFGPYA
jgi:hypothetical protein